MTNKAKVIKNYFDEKCFGAKCTLDYFSDYSLLIAVMLSAQCRDERVNLVTKNLFFKYKSLEELNKASLEEIEEYLKPLGLYKNKAMYLKGMVKVLIEKYDGKVPSIKDELEKLPGVGNKTANVMLAEYFKIPAFPVDTHVERVSKRLNLAKKDDSTKMVEEKLKKTFDKQDWIDLHHKFIFFGRHFCKAKNPSCDDCKLKEICSFYLTKTN